MKTKPPADRRKFAGLRDELDYLYHKLLYWLYEREDRERARAFADRIARLLSKKSLDHDAIFPEECWSLVCEARQDLSGAIRHRENEIQLIKRLHDSCQNDSQQHLIFRLYGYDDLSDRLDLLAVLYHESGHLDLAIITLIESKQLCQKHGIKFDGADILQDIQHKSLQSKMNSHWNLQRKMARRLASPKRREVI